MKRVTRAPKRVPLSVWIYSTQNMDTLLLENAAPAVLHEETQDSLQNLDFLSDSEILLAYIPGDRAPSAGFWDSYNTKQITIGRLACLHLWKASGSRLVPHEFQLKATIATMSGQHSLIDVGTGKGKTLCMVLPSLLYPLWSACRLFKSLISSTMASALWLSTKIHQMIHCFGRSGWATSY